MGSVEHVDERVADLVKENPRERLDRGGLGVIPPSLRGGRGPRFEELGWHRDHPLLGPVGGPDRVLLDDHGDVTGQRVVVVQNTHQIVEPV